MSKQFESLTKYIDLFENADNRSLLSVSTDFENDIMKFVNEYRESNLTNYSEILEKNGYSFERMNIKEIDISDASSELILAMIVFVYRHACHLDSSIIMNYDKELLISWLKKLTQFEKGNPEGSKI